MATNKDAATKRLMKDLQEVLENPLQNVVATPEEANVFRWHVNLRPEEDSALAGACIHLTFIFHNTYPTIGPEIFLATPLPHPNVHRTLDGRWRLHVWDCIPEFKGWTSAYSVHSILLQLQAFLLDEDLQYDTDKVTPERALELANQSRCDTCPHWGGGPKQWPRFHTDEDIANAAQKRRRQLVSRPIPSLLLRSLPRSKKESVQPAPDTAVCPRNAPPLDSSHSPVPTASTSTQKAPSPSSVTAEDPPPADEWTTVTAKGFHKRGADTAYKAPVSHGSTSSAASATIEAKRPKQKALGGLSSRGPPTTSWAVLLSATEDGTPAVVPLPSTKLEEASDDASALPGSSSSSARKGSPEKKSSKKNKVRSLRRSRAKAGVTAGREEETRGSRSAAGPEKQWQQEEEPQEPAGILPLSNGKSLGADEGGTAVTTRASGSSALVEKDRWVEEESRPLEMGTLGVLPTEAVTEILCRLPLEGLGNLSMTCRALRVACEDGAVWRVLMHRHYPASSLMAATLDDWKHAFMLEASSIVGALQCYHTRSTYEEGVLGFPLRFTVNPRTKSVDYIEVDFNLLSETAFTTLKMRTDVDNKPFDLLLPLYLTADHFERALPFICKTLRKLCPEWRSNGFDPRMVLDVMPKIVNTLVVLISDKGVAASERALDAFCSIHRLFLGLVDRFALWKVANLEVAKFTESEKGRGKDSCASLGHLMPLLGVCTGAATSWRAVVQKLVAEMFDRNVLWACKNKPGLDDLLKVPPQTGGVDKELLSGWLEGCQVAMRLVCFHAGFLQNVARPNGVSYDQVAAGYDALYGRASHATKKSFHAFVKSVLSISSWPHFLKVVGLADPGPEAVTRWLRQSWLNSLRKKYHCHDTNFAAIHRSGVSKILLKGESYTAPPNMKRVKMAEKWRFESTHGVKYLDASCLIYDFDNRFVEVVDYMHLVSSDGAVVHSGDVIDYSKCEGTHTIDIQLGRVSEKVKEMYFTMSGWAGVTLSQIKMPFVQLTDPATNMDLCEYHLEDKQKGNNTCVVMCRMHRKDASRDATWQVEALGNIGMGAADNYEPMKSYISDLIMSRSPPRFSTGQSEQPGL